MSGDVRLWGLGGACLLGAACSPWRGVEPGDEGAERLTALDCIEVPSSHTFEPLLLTGRVDVEPAQERIETVEIRNTCDVAVPLGRPLLDPVESDRGTGIQAIQLPGPPTGPIRIPGDSVSSLVLRLSADTPDTYRTLLQLAPLGVDVQGDILTAAPRTQPFEVNFGSVQPGCSASETVSIGNQGRGPLTVRAVRIDGVEDVMSLDKDLPSLPWVLVAGDQVDLDVVFAPRRRQVGVATGTLIFETDAAYQGSYVPPQIRLYGLAPQQPLASVRHWSLPQDEPATWRLPLSHRPVPDSLEVRVQNEPFSDWHYDPVDNVVVLDRYPGWRVTVVVHGIHAERDCG